MHLRCVGIFNDNFIANSWRVSIKDYENRSVPHEVMSKNGG